MRASELWSSKHNVVMCYSLMMVHAASARKITGFGWTAYPMAEINNLSFLRKYQRNSKNNSVLLSSADSVVNDTLLMCNSTPL